MTSKPPTYRPTYQREYLVDRGFQLKYALIFGAAACAVALVGGAAMYGVLQGSIRELSLPPELWRQLSDSVPEMIGAVVATALVMGVVIGLFALVLTHRVAGPIYVMTRYIAVLAEGHFPKMRRLRASDEFRDLFDLFQKSVEFIRTRDVADAFRIEEAIAKLAPQANTAEARSAIEALKALRDRKRAIAERSDLDGHTVFASPDAPAVTVPPPSPKNLPS
jgi:hypothetical protein